MTVLQYWYNRRSQYGIISLNRIQQTVGSSGGQLALGLLGMRSMGGLLLGTLAGQAYAFFNLRRRGSDLHRKPGPDTPSMKALLSRYRRMPLLNMPTALVDAVRINGVIMILGSTSLGATGQFNMAWRLLEIPVGLINSAVSQVFFQKLARVKPGQMLPLVRWSIVRSFILAVVPFTLLYIVAPWLFPLLLGAKWHLAGEFARALTPWLVLQLASSPISTVFVVTETQHWMLAYSILYCAVPLAILQFSPWTLLFTIQVLGAAMASMLAIMLLLALLSARRYDSRPAPAEPVDA